MKKEREVDVYSIYGEKIESNNFHELMKYARQLRMEIPLSGVEEIGKTTNLEWKRYDTKDKIWKVIRSLPEYYFG